MIIGVSIQTDICQVLGKEINHVHSIEREASTRTHVVRCVGLTKIQTTTRPDHVWPEIWTKIGKAAQNREKRNGQKQNQGSTMLED